MKIWCNVQVIIYQFKYHEFNNQGDNLENEQDNNECPIDFDSLNAENCAQLQQNNDENIRLEVKSRKNIFHSISRVVYSAQYSFLSPATNFKIFSLFFFFKTRKGGK